MPSPSRITIIGAGPGGYVAAIRAAQLGMQVTLIEKSHLGGICLNWGCIPTKSLLRSAEVLNLARDGASFGLSISRADFSLPDLIRRSRTISRRLAAGVKGLLKKNGVTTIMGQARIAEAGLVVVDGNPAQRIETDHIVIATGARPRTLSGLTPNGTTVWTYFDALNPPTLPRHLVVIGSGAIGVEFACFYHALGCEVTVMEALSQILPQEDVEIAGVARKRMEKSGIRFLPNTRFESLESGGAGTEVTVVARSLASDSASVRLPCDIVLSAAGVQGNVENLGLESVGVSVSRGCVDVSAGGATSTKGIYAIGDVAGPPMLAHKAEHEGVNCVEAIAGGAPHSLNHQRIPACIYGVPQIASVGITEAEAKNNGMNVRIGRFPFQANGKALALGDTDGLVKTIWNRDTGALIGAHLVGPEVTELVHSFVVAMELEACEEDLMKTIFPHPTLSETIHESTLSAFDRAIHI